jgi:hypothetical protein
MRWAPRIAGGALILTIASSVATVGFTRGRDVIASIVILVWLTVLAAVGGVLGARRPAIPIGWLMLGAAVCVSLGSFADSYASYSLELSRGPLPFDMFFAWLAAWITLPGFGMLLFVLLLFPTGTLGSSSWRWAGRFVAAVFGTLSILLALRPGPIDVVPVVNPVGIRGAGEPIRFLTEGPGGTTLTAAALVIVLARIGVLLITLRKASVVERQQTKWFVYSVITGVLIIGSTQAMFALVGTEGILNVIGFLAIMAGLMFIPVAMGVSILRYRLYDIDRIINRTIVYVLVTGSLVAVYAGTVFVAGTVAVGRDDNVTVAAATLVAAAAFRPLLGRVQSFVDRRFYRHKYDAQKMIDAFGSRLREETDLDELADDLVRVVRTTMQPAHASLWLQRPEVES